MPRARLSEDTLREAVEDRSEEASSDAIVEARLVWKLYDLGHEQHGEVLLDVGGAWHSKRRRRNPLTGEVRLGDWVPGAEVKRARVVWIHRGQEKAARFCAWWLRVYAAGDRLEEIDGRRRSAKLEQDIEAVYSVLFVGGRRGGKSDMAEKFGGAFAVAIPSAKAWAISPTGEETLELKDAFDALWPRAWFKYRKTKTGGAYFMFNGTRVELRSGYKPSTLKRGRVDFVLLNEAQNLQEKAFIQCRGAVADTGGIVVCAANPPDEPIGEWVERFYDEAKAGKRKARVFEFDPLENPFVKRESLEAMAGDMSEKEYNREVRGIFEPIGDRAFHAWSPRENVLDGDYTDEASPIGLPWRGAIDVTRAFTKRHFGRDFDDIVGADFQLTPHMAAVRYRAYLDPAPELGQVPFERGGEPILVLVGECVVENATEADLCDAMERELGLVPARTVVIADASGDWQDAQRRIGRNSFNEMHSAGWRNIYPPDKERKNNPNVVERLKVANARFGARREGAQPKRWVFSLAENGATNTGLRRWPLKNGMPDRRHEFAHVSDAVTYPLWRFYPRKAKRKAFSYVGAGASTMTNERKNEYGF